MTVVNPSQPNQNWFRIRYTDSAPDGLPPVIQAEHVIRVRDDSGTWVIALWESRRSADAVPAACILRVPADQVLDVVRHEDLVSAVNSYVFD